MELDRNLVRTQQVYLINDSYQNRKQYNIPKAQLVLTDIPYNVGNKAYGSNPQWYIDGDNKNGELCPETANYKEVSKVGIILREYLPSSGVYFPQRKNLITTL